MPPTISIPIHLADADLFTLTPFTPLFPSRRLIHFYRETNEKILGSSDSKTAILSNGKTNVWPMKLLSAATKS